MPAFFSLNKTRLFNKDKQHTLAYLGSIEKYDCKNYKAWYGKNFIMYYCHYH